MTQKPDCYDVAVIGAGSIGAAFACRLGLAGLRVALIDPYEPRLTIPPRVSALNSASQQLLDSIGVWPGLSADSDLPPQAIHEMRIWDSEGSGEIHFSAADSGQPVLGWIVSDYYLRQVLWQCAKRIRTIDLFCPARLVATEVSATCRKIALDTRCIETRLLVGADGARSRVREIAGIATRARDYHQHAIVTTVRPEFSHQNTAWQRFMPTGPLALLPLANGCCSVVWSLSGELVGEHLALESSVFSARLTDAFAGRLGQLCSLDRPVSFPLRALSATDYVQRRLALIGDAAHVVHPLAGQGANLGFLDVADLSERIIAAHASGADPGGIRALRAYQRCRKAENLQAMCALDGIERIFGTAIKPLSMLRNFGMNLIDTNSPIKYWLGRQATGLSTTSRVKKLYRLPRSG